jgi:hypothetical protein
LQPNVPGSIPPEAVRRLSFIRELGSGNMRHGGGSGRVEPPVHIPARLEGGEYLLGYRDLGPIARVSSSACPACSDRKHSKVTQFDPISPRQGGCDGVQDRVDEGLDIPLVQGAGFPQRSSRSVQT